ncbi:Putative NADH:flavin oxidoreductase/NADH oxidase, aldolase-type TIM barrel, oxidoreductase Oye [Septoria linicola]|uniref:NADH:flavin oxidoreductase/NADH oxidase, aldolase-type TIM barrel, oxidoreductase Oye n=1 Tax=Septoria linicola TaxID=215465 RepID=A0A9Q9B0X4_9PEZI|nr:putative NADH:flavin oxidoreductase/NADH oxidase, aldolase-type TIM barrel, oxidoreductase Oye [Septoria linicola]USW55437.1 Putative NADH:flavin oxidoreductase/NADH oxidase, aldolase-type TIM barrel, oxidoreductase Oye [Septoria linicola]
MSLDKLFRPLKLGNTEISHRLVMAPLTRFRADTQHNPNPLAKQYYAQRASTPGTLIITEATFISPRAGGYKHIPGIWSESQIAGWKDIVGGIHAQGSPAFMQLWALGRVAQGNVLEEEEEGGPYEVVSASAIAVDAKQTNSGAPTSVPHELSESEIQVYIRDYAQAAENAVEAGFDGVELHGANGYLIDQFWQDVSNQRTDAWGGSVEKRARFGLEVTKAVIEAVGDSRKVGMRLSPWGNFQGMGMEDPRPQFEYIVKELKKLDLAYLHLIESRASGSAADGVYHDKGTEELQGLIDLWGSKDPLILAGGFTPEKAVWAINEVARGDNLAIGFGRYFISTPDLPYRLKHGLPLNKWNRKTFYTPGAEGLVDYEFSKEWLAEHSHESRL